MAFGSAQALSALLLRSRFVIVGRVAVRRLFAMAPKRRWEMAAAGAAEETAHSWERPDLPGDSTSDSDAGPSVAETPGDQFVDYLVGLFLARDLSAKSFCTIMHLACEAGVSEAKRYAYKPDAPSGHFNRHLLKTMPALSQIGSLYQFQIPSFHRDALARGEHTLFTLPAHEALDEALRKDTSSGDRLQSAIAEGRLPPAYFSHPVVRGSQTPVHPVSIFVDGVPYSLGDAVIGVWLVCELSGARFLVAALRKHLMCVCGCRGWCTLYGLFAFLRWCIEAMARGTYPTVRHDGGKWTSGDPERKAKAGQAMVRKAAVVFLKGDWAEYAQTLGLPNWQDSMRPCFGCNVSPSQMYSIRGLSPVTSPWRDNLEQDYFESCSRCERFVTITAANHKRLLEVLAYDRRRGGGHGRCLTADVPEMGLAKGDRLEPSEQMPDPGQFDGASQFPMVVVFWRPALETLARHRNPLFSSELGVSPARSLTVDTLHAVFLGVMNVFCKYVAVTLFQAGVFGQQGTQQETFEVGAMVLRHRLKAFYQSRHRQNPTEKLTRITSFTKKTLGDLSDKAMRTKGAETWGFFLFLITVLETDTAAVGQEGAALLEAARAMRRMVDTWTESEANVRPRQIQECFDCWLRFCRLTADIPQVHIPKRHLVAHLLGNLGRQGCPRLYSNWLDESWNKCLKRACRGVSQASFEAFLLVRMKELLAKPAAPKRKAS